MCEGGEGAGASCSQAQDAECLDCRHSWECEDTSAPGACPGCGKWNITIRRCESCPVDLLSHVRAHSHAGRLFERALELEFDTKNFAVPWSEITAEEVKALQILKDERDRYLREQAKKDEEARRRGL